VIVRHPYALLLALALALPGCDYFKPEDPEPPVGDTISGDYSSPDATLRTIADAVTAKGQPGAAQAYAGAFADSTLNPGIPGYHQDFYPLDATRWIASGRTVPADWNVVLETRFYDNGTQSLIQRWPGQYQLTWEPDPSNPDRTGINPTLLHRRYTLLSLDEGGVPLDVVARGFADLTFHQAGNGNWYITRWEDREDPEPYDPTGALVNVTWGQRRLEYQ
jgi:hypothetical protein